MNLSQKAPQKPLFTDKKSADIFIGLFIEEHHKRIAKSLFVDGLTNEETAYKIGYSKRQIERIRTYLLRAAVKRLIEKQIPKKPLDVEKTYSGDYGYCPSCKKVVSDSDNYRICNGCGQALLWE